MYITWSYLIYISYVIYQPSVAFVSLKSELQFFLSWVETRQVFEKHRCPRRQQSWNMAKISKSYILTSPHPQGHGMSVKCEQSIDELTVQVWLLYHHPNFKYCTLFVSGTELRTDKQTARQTDRRTDDPITRCPGARRTFQAGGIKIEMCLTLTHGELGKNTY